LAQSFEGLSDKELDDLAKIDPRGFRIYSNSIFVGEKRLIDNNFPLSINAIRRFWRELYGERFDLLWLVKKLHKVKPWHSTATTVLCRNFCEFICERYPELLSAAPYLEELLEFELLSRKIRRAPDDPLCKSAITLSEFAALSVEE